MNNIAGILLSFVFILGVLGIAQLLLRRTELSASLTRKIVHISVAHWWFIAMVFFDSLAAALVGPVVFTIVNYLSYRFGIFKAMEHEDRRKNLGTIYFPISLIVLVTMSFTGWMPVYVAGIGVLVMGYGDGFASIIGERYGSHSAWLRATGKSVAGTATMFIASFVAVAVFLLAVGAEQSVLHLLVASASTAALAAAVELVTPFGLDNLSVPISSALFYFGLFA